MTERNYLRLGFTETTLLFYYFLHQYHKHEVIKIIDDENKLLQWLYSTSGFYEKTIEGNYFNFDAIKIKKSSVYHEYFKKLLNLIKTDINIRFCFHQINTSLNVYKEQFLKSINQSYDDILSVIKNKSVLIINNLSILMKQQYESGNMKKICPQFPPIKKIYFYQTCSTFLNNGPHNSILETSKIMCNDIKDVDFECAVVSSGAYSSLLFDYIVNTLHKQCYVTGGDLPVYFGINTKRIKKFNSHMINEYFIDVPNELKPIHYEKIEGGCYW